MRNRKLILLTMLMALTNLNSFAGQGSDGENGDGRLSKDLSYTQDLTFYNKSGEAKKLSISEEMREIKTSTYKEGWYYLCRNNGLLTSKKVFGKIFRIYKPHNNINVDFLATNNTILLGEYVISGRHRGSNQYCFSPEAKASKKELEQEINNSFIVATDRITLYYDQLMQLFDGKSYYEEYFIRKDFKLALKKFNTQIVKDFIHWNNEARFRNIVDIIKKYKTIDKIANFFDLQTSSYTTFSNSLDLDLINRVTLQMPIGLFSNALSDLDIYIKNTSRYLPGTEGWNKSIEEMRVFWSQSTIRSFYDYLGPIYLDLQLRLSQTPQILFNREEIYIYDQYPQLETLVESYGLN